jgi:hypothetical protein
MSETRPDPRRRPPDPAGTQPKVDPESLRAPAHALAAHADAGAEPPPMPHRLLSADPASAGTAPAGAAPAAGPAPAATATSSLEIRTKPPRTRPGSTHAPRFQFLFGALGALAVGAIALAVALLRAPAAAPEAAWSAWHPSGSEVDPAQQIAEYVGPLYRLDNGKQLVKVSGGPPLLNGQVLTVGVYRSGTKPARLEGNNVLYRLCGSGPSCSIAEGKPSLQRAELLWREGLELALYTFHYVSGVEHVVVMIPPRRPAGTQSKAHASGTGTTLTAATGTALGEISHNPPRALLFDQQELAGALESPLTATLSLQTPRVAQVAHWPDTPTVKALTERYLQDYTLEESQESGPIMLLLPLGAGG